MASNVYHFITHWHVEGSIEDVYRLISHPEEFPRWWPQVYLKVEPLSPADEKGVGRRVRLLTRGWLPYKLRWESRSTEADPPRRLALEATGDFEGRGVWTLAQEDRFVNLTFDWKIAAEKPLLRYLSFLFKPVFAANHRWAMARGQEAIRRELARMK